MTNLSRDFRDILSSFSDEDVEYLVVGGYALAAHGLPRSTGDIDLWINPTAPNAPRVYQALLKFGAPADRFQQSDFQDADLILQIGIPPARIDVITAIEGVSFVDAWPNRTVLLLDGLSVNFLGREELLVNKRAVGRPQDRADVSRLENQSKKR